MTRSKKKKRGEVNKIKDKENLTEFDFNVKIEKNFFGSGHGKRPADGCSSVVKSAVHRAMVAGTVINSATYFFDYCNTHFTKDESHF